MNRAAAWSVRGVGRETRDAAEEAARRAGMSLGEWLDEVIADQAADQGVDPEDWDENQRLEAISERLAGGPGRGEARAGRLRRDSADSRAEPRPRAQIRPAAPDESARAEELLNAAISKFESRAAKSDARTARAFDSVASLIERSQDERRDEREAFKAVVGRLESLEERIARQQTERDALAKQVAMRNERAATGAREAEERDALKVVVGRLESLEERIGRQQAERDALTKQLAARMEPRADNARDLDERLNELSRRIGAPDKSRVATRGRPRIDIDDAVSQIARRRQELDAQTASSSPEPLKGSWRNFGVDAPVAKSVEPTRPIRAAAAEPAAAEPAARAITAQEQSSAAALQAEIRKLSQRLDEMRREQNEKREAPAANIEALRAELAAMSRNLADLAPRNAVVALEGAIRDLGQRVAACRENGARDNLLAPVEGLVAGLREALRAHDPRDAVEALQREIGAIGAKVDGISGAHIDPATFERIRRQIEETRGFLGALAQRLAPLDRLEKQIGELADRVDRLSTSPAPRHESAELAALLAEARALVERSTPPSALSSIEWRLEQIASKIDQALERPSAASAPPFNSGAFEDLSRRIDGVRESIETHYASPPGAPLDTRLLEQTMREISAKLDRPIAAVDPTTFESMIQDLGARIDRRANPVIDTAPLEQVLRKLGERPAAVDTRPIEGLMREISAKLDQSTSSAIDAGAFENMIHELGARIDRRPETIVDTRPLEQTLRSLHDKIDQGVAVDASALDTRPLEELMREISAKLDHSTSSAIDAGAFENMIHELGARIDRRPETIVDTRPLEQTLRSLHDKIDQGVAVDASALDTRPLEGLMREISAKLDRPSPPVVEVGAFEGMIRDLGARLDRQPEPIVDMRPIEQTIRALHDKIDQSAAAEAGALERMVAELLAELDETRRALRDAPASSLNAPAADEAFARGLADLRAEQSNSDRRMQSTLGGVHDMLERLVDRIGQIEDDVARRGAPPREASNALLAAGGSGPASAALNSMDATIREAPVFAPARSSPEPRIDKEPEPRASQFASAAPMRSIDGSEFLIEPGSGAPLRAHESDALAATNPKSAVNVHIAAARRAAQAALAETATNVAKGGAKASADSAQGAEGVEQPKGFFAARRRPILLGVALVALLAIALVELGVMRQSNVQKSEADTVAPPQLASVAPAKDAGAPTAPAKIETRAVDMTPVGAISAAPANGPTTKFLTPAPADLVASIPAGAPQALRAAAAAGDPAAQFELASRLADGRGMTRDPHAAFLWFDRAAAQGLAPAQYRLGSFYEKGLGVTRDTALAMEWYKKAAEAGNARAMHNLAVLTAEGADIKPDYSEAANWFQKAAQLGVKDSQYNLAILYARGMGVAADVSQSWFWFSLAAQQGDLDAAKKRDEVAAKMDAKALADEKLVLANFHATVPTPAANDVPAPPGGWDAGKIGTTPMAPASPPPTSPQATNAAPHAAHAAAAQL
jgi:localization factor PodJL